MLLFKISDVIYHNRVFFQMGEGNAAIQSGGKLPVLGEWGQFEDS
jgi:hypothetical protein